MDPMEIAERERELKEDEDRRELESVIGLVDFVNEIDEVNARGKEVHPSGKARKDIQLLSEALQPSQAALKRSFPCGAVFRAGDPTMTPMVSASSRMRSTEA